MKISSIIRIESEVLPGVFFVIRKISKARRDEIDAIVRPVVEAMPDREEYAALTAERSAGPLSEEKEARWGKLTSEAARLYARQVQPVLVRCGFVRIEGLEIETADGVIPATLDTLSDCCDEADQVYQEIVDAVERERGLSVAEAKNSGSPSTSAALEGGKPESAAPVESAETTILSAA